MAVVGLGLLLRCAARHASDKPHEEWGEYDEANYGDGNDHENSAHVVVRYTWYL